MKMNFRMRARLAHTEVSDLIQSLELSESLRNLLVSQIVEFEGCIFLEPLLKLSPNATLSLFPDRTGFECFVNHIHVEDYLDQNDGTNPTSNLQLASCIRFAMKLKERLGEYQSKGRFRVIITSDDETCTVRFHKIRENETWLSEDLEQYREEAVGVIETDMVL